MSKNAEYYVKQVDETHFEVSKFQDGEAIPSRVYKVTWDPSKGGGGGRCDCPAASYRGTGPNDKHVLMVKNWWASSHKPKGG